MAALKLMKVLMPSIFLAEHVGVILIFLEAKVLLEVLFPATIEVALLPYLSNLLVNWWCPFERFPVAIAEPLIPL